MVLYKTKLYDILMNKLYSDVSIKLTPSYAKHDLRSSTGGNPT